MSGNGGAGLNRSRERKPRRSLWGIMLARRSATLADMLCAQMIRFETSTPIWASWGLCKKRSTSSASIFMEWRAGSLSAAAAAAEEEVESPPQAFPVPL